MKEYDEVKVIRDRDEYLEEGVHAGDVGYIILDRICEYCCVQFFYPNYETVETGIRTEDLEVVTHDWLNKSERYIKINRR